MTKETSDLDQRRLYVAHVTIEFDFAFVATPNEAESGEVASNLINDAARDLSSLHDYATVKVNLAAPAYELPIGACDDDAVCGLRTADGWSVKWKDAVENDKRLHADLAPLDDKGSDEGPHVCTGRSGDGPCELERSDVRPPDCPSCGATEKPCGDVGDEADDEPAPVVRLDYSEPPPGAEMAPLPAHLRGTIETTGVWGPRALAAAWAKYKAENDPPGMRVLQTSARQGDIVQTVWVFFVTEAGGVAYDWYTEPSEAGAAAWAWHDRRLALAGRLDAGVFCPQCRSQDAHVERIDATTSTQPWCTECDVEMGGLFDDVWPRILTWTDEQVAEVERWLVDSTAEMPKVLHG